MTKIPIKTIQEYVSSFREHFSDKAGQAKKGRRFLPADIDRLQTIKRLRSARIPDEEIKQILAGEIPFKLAHQFNEDEVKNMAAHSLEIYEQAKSMLEEVNDIVAKTKTMIAGMIQLQTQVKQENQSVKNEVQVVMRELVKFRQWQLFVMKFDPELNPYKPEDPNEPIAEMQNEKKSIFAFMRKT